MPMHEEPTNEPMLHEADLVITDETQADRIRRLVARVIRDVLRPDQADEPPPRDPPAQA
jgi:uncharacterized protein (DUF2267 family)